MAAIAAAVALVSAGVLAPAQSASAVTYPQITGDGSTWAQPAINQWDLDVSQFGLQVSYGGVGSTTGRNDFKNGVVNFAASEIPYGMQDGAAFDPPPAQGYTYMPDVAGGLAFMYNLVIGGQRVTNLRMAGKTVSDIFTGVIQFWDDPELRSDNPQLALPHTPIIPVVRADGAGTTAAFTQWMLATQPADWQAYCAVVGRTPCTQTSFYPVSPTDPNMVAQTGDPGVAGYVAQSQSDGAIGFVSYSFALAAGFPVAKVLNAAGYYTAPTAANVGVSLLAAQVNSNPNDPLYQTADLSGVYTDPDPRTYELSSYSYLILPTDLTANIRNTSQGLSLGAYGSFLLCQGQQQVDALGYSALPINLVEAGYAQLARVPGASLPATTSAFIQGCNNPTFSPDGTNLLGTTDPQPPACDQQGPAQCASGPVNTATTVSTSPAAPTVGQSVTLSAIVTAVGGTGPPTGSVQFEIGGTSIGGPVALDANGGAQTTTTFTSPQTTIVAAAYTPADANAFNPSSGSIIVTPTRVSAVTQTLTTTVVPAGAFSFTGPTAAAITMTESASTATGAMVPVTVTDTRNTYPGWSVVGQVANFTNTAVTGPGTVMPGNQLGWVPTDTSLASGTMLGPTVAPGAPGLGTAPAVLASASAGTGLGTSTLGANLTLVIPPNTVSGPYTSTLTLTANPAGL